MIKRMVKELTAERRTIYFTLVLMFLFTLGLSKFQLDSFKSEICSMDSFVYTSRVMAVSIFSVSSFLSISINKNNFKPDRVILSKNNSSVWNYSVAKAVIMSFVLSVFVFIMTLVFSRFFLTGIQKKVFFILRQDTLWTALIIF